MKTKTTKKRSQKGLISTGVILVAFLALLLIQGAAQAFSTTVIFIIWRGGW